MSLPLTPSRITLSFAYSYIERAFSECLARRQFGAVEKAQVIEFFGSPVSCVYCGNLDVKRWDHLVAVNNGGETVIGNMVPACQKCDDSKQHKPFEEWMVGSAPSSPQSRGIKNIDDRMAKIRQYIAHFNYVVSPLSERLTADEMSQLQSIRNALAKCRVDGESLIEQFNARVADDA